VRPDHRKEDLYRVIASGVGGTAMPTWKGSLPDEEIWALVHYVDSLVASKGTEAARTLRHANEAAEAQSTQPPPR
jgi:mono/diheme cytochrome c family protein